MYLLDADGVVDRLSFPSRPRAFDADGTGRVLVVAEDVLWMLRPLQRERRSVDACLPEPPIRHLELGGDWILVRGDSLRVCGLRSARREDVRTYGTTTLTRAGGLLTVSRQGEVSIRRVDQKHASRFTLALLPAERIISLVGRKSAVLVMTNRRCLLVSADGRVSWGLLPQVLGRPVPVRFEAGAAPWLLVGGRVFRPHRGGLSAKTPCDRVDARRWLSKVIHAQDLNPLPRAPCWSAWLPRVELSVYADRRRAPTGRGDVHELEGEWNVGFFLSMAWYPDRAIYCDVQTDREALRRAVLDERQDRLEELTRWLSAWRENCRRGDAATTEEIEAYVRVLSGDL
jgi:hypothetical protein